MYCTRIPEQGRLEEGVRPSLPLLLSSLCRVTVTATTSFYCLINFYSGHLQDSPTESALAFDLELINVLLGRWLD